MENILQPLMYKYLETNPGIGDPPTITLTVPTHDPNRDNSKFRISDAGKCHLMRFWKRRGIEPTNSPSFDNKLVMESGNLLHAWFQYALSEMGVLEAAEQEVQDAHKLGHLDCILAYENTRILYDLKTISGKKMYYLHKNGDKPDKQHIYQVLTYHSLLDSFTDEVRIAYISRDTLEICECVVHLGNNALIEVADDWSALITAWKVNMTSEPNPEPWECRYCIYCDACSRSQN